MTVNKNVLMALWHANSRKVAFALLLFSTATVLAVKKIITSTDWMWCVGAATGLVGGGTLADTWFKKGGENAVSKGAGTEPGA